MLDRQRRGSVHCGFLRCLLKEVIVPYGERYESRLVGSWSLPSLRVVEDCVCRAWSTGVDLYFVRRSDVLVGRFNRDPASNRYSKWDANMKRKSSQPIPSNNEVNAARCLSSNDT